MPKITLTPPSSLATTLKAKCSLHNVIKNYIETEADVFALAYLEPSNIHFTEIHNIANKKHTPFSLHKIITHHANILIPENASNFWETLEALQASAFSPLISKNIVVGTFAKMKETYPNEIFVSNQMKPDTYHFYKKSFVDNKINLGIDYKNLGGKTKMHGKNQVLIGNFDKYSETLDCYYENLRNEHTLDVLDVIDNLRLFAKNNNWEHQILLLAENAHRFPPNNLPPLNINTTIPLKCLTLEMQEQVQRSIEKLLWISEQAYYHKVPEISQGVVAILKKKF